jgi:hypothetical protein
MYAELLINIALGAQNKYFKEHGILSRDKNEDAYIEEQMNDFYNDHYHYCYHESINLHPINKNKFVIPYHDGYISNIYLHIALDDIEYEELMEKIFDKFINLRIGGNQLNYMTVFCNIFIATLNNINIKYYDNYVAIPIMSLTLLHKYFPRYPVKSNIIEILLEKIYLDNIFISYDIYKYDVEKPILTFKSLFCTTTGYEPITKNKKSLCYNHVNKFLIINFNHKNTNNYLDIYNYPIINNIKLYFNGFSLSFNFENGGLIYTSLHGQPIYVISLTHEYKNVKDFKSLFNRDKMSGYGINFSRIDDIYIKIEYDNYDDIENDFLYTVYSVGYNISRTIGGMFGFIYS